ncbi:hypothetical protein [Cyanobium sp. T1G-Tous]|uniref:hypothetical protein n=1 Tax=Cyanobium sp. T1G-Tous TaxID=2823722 RepID=UPI0020CEB77E|nr:hypothetical protein [Cyanobium sp. T1G-Tous]
MAIVEILTSQFLNGGSGLVVERKLGIDEDWLAGVGDQASVEILVFVWCGAGVKSTDLDC